MSSQYRMALREWGLLVLLSCLWGGSYFSSKVALQELPPFTVVLTRVVLAAVALGFYLRLQGRRIRAGFGIWRSFAGMGALNNLIPFALIFWGQTHISSGLASILVATTPVFSLLVAHALTSDEKLAVNKLVGIILGLVGVIAMLGSEAATGTNDTLLAILACLGAALSYGFANVFGRRFKRMDIEPAVSAFGQVTATAVMMLPITFVFDAPWLLTRPSLTVWVALVGLALLSTALAYIIFFHLLATIGATNTSLVTLLIPVSAIFFGNVFLGERLSISQTGGMAIIGLGLMAMDGRFWRAGGALGSACPRTRSVK